MREFIRLKGRGPGMEPPRKKKALPGNDAHPKRGGSPTGGTA
jgi:hypothetical protein